MSYYHQSANDVNVPHATTVNILPPPSAPTTSPSYQLPPKKFDNVGSTSGDGGTDEEKKKDTERMIQELVEQGYTRGLASSLVSTTCEVFPLRIWVVDNSGSMNKADGHRMIGGTQQNANIRMVSCTRWDEIRECVNYHVKLSALLQSATSFRLLNHPGAGIGNPQFGIAEYGQTSPSDLSQSVQLAMDIMRKSSPTGVTPLTRHIREIYQIVQSMSPTLLSQGQRIVIVLATDGLPTDENGIGGEYVRQEFVSSLRLLEGLPVWVVIRLCTDEEDVVSFYNDLDEQLELSLEVLDDFVGEAEEVNGCNGWLNYALPLHRMREMGYHDRIFDMLDERALTVDELRSFRGLLFGEDCLDGVADPSMDWRGFLSDVGALLRKEQNQWDPIKKKSMPWIDLQALDRKYGNNPASCDCVIL